MKLLTAAAMMIATSLFGQNALSTSEGPVYDKGGHLSAYVYADGKTETYTYDSSWRMRSFTDRNGFCTLFAYNPDGSVSVLEPSDR